MNPERTIELNGKSYPIVWSTNAAFQLGLYLRQNKLGKVSDFMVRMAVGDADVVEVQLLTWACMEGGRRRTRSRVAPFTVDEVGDLLEQSGGIQGITGTLAEVVRAAFGSDNSKVAGEADQKNEVPPTNRTGKRSSAKRRRSESAPTTSGT